MATKLPVIAEKYVQKAVIDLLTAEKVFFMRLNTGVMKTEKRFVRFNKPGTPDILAAPIMRCRYDPNEYNLNREITVCGPVFLWLEIKKSKGGIQSKEQKEFQGQVEACGHNYLLISDVDQLRDWLKNNR